MRIEGLDERGGGSTHKGRKKQGEGKKGAKKFPAKFELACRLRGEIISIFP